MSKLIISSHVSEDRRQRTLTRAELPFIFILAIEMTQMSQWEGFILILKRILKSECCCIEIGDECIDFKMIRFCARSRAIGARNARKGLWQQKSARALLEYLGILLKLDLAQNLATAIPYNIYVY